MNKKEIITKYIPEELLGHLYNGLYMSIGHVIYKATVRVFGTRGFNREYFLDFIECSKDMVKDILGAKAVKDIYDKYNYDYEYPIPCNIKEDYEFVVDGIIWNSYLYPAYDFKVPETDKELLERCPATMKLFTHIYRESLILGLDYMTVEFMNPSQPLPVQVLYSRENKTAKSTVLNHRKYVYGKNGTVIDSETFEDKFNGPVVAKNFVGIDEGKLRNEHSMEKIKMKVTAPTIQFRAMRKSAIEVPNFCKWMIATNLDNFAKLDKYDSRFWVIKAEPIVDKYDPDFEIKLKNEIPYWIGFLKRRWELRENKDVSGLFKMDTPFSKDRLWFHEDQYTTEHLQKIKRASLSLFCKDFMTEMIEWFDKLNDRITEDSHKVSDVYCTVKLLRDNLPGLDPKITTSHIKRILENDLGFKEERSDDGEIKNLSFINYFEFNTGDLPSKIRRRNVYCISYAKLLFMRDGIIINDGKIMVPEQLEINI